MRNAYNKLHNGLMAMLRIAGVVVVLFVVGCTHHAAEMDDVERAESLLMSDPVEALAIMESIDREHIATNSELAHYALVYSEACYYNRKLITSDSLTSICFNYFKHRNDHDHRARACFQHGMVQQLANQNPEAILSYIEALQSLKVHPNNRLKGVVYRSMGDVYRSCFCYQRSFEEYNLAYNCFKKLDLPYHTYYTIYNMGQAMLKMRNYEEAEAYFIQARDYAIETANKDFLCAVLHELCEIYLQQKDYEKCSEVVAMFEEYDCVLWFVSRYYAVRALVCCYQKEYDLAEQYIALAESQPHVDEAIIEKAKYRLYSGRNDKEMTMYWMNKIILRLDKSLVEASNQPVLTYQIDMLRNSLENQKEAAKITRQRNVALYVTIAIIATILIAVFRGFSTKRKRDIQQYIDTIHELQLTTRNTSDSLSEAVDHLYNDRLTDLNRLCDTYYEYSDTSRHSTKVFEQVCETIESIKSDEARIEELEKLVNNCRDNLMQKLREQCPRLNAKEQRVVLYSYAGFSSRAICVFMETNPVALSKTKYRIKLKIKECDAKDADLLISSLGDR